MLKATGNGLTKYKQFNPFSVEFNFS